MGIKFQASLVILLVLLLLNGGCLGCWEEERIALLHLKEKINFPNGTSLPTWVDSHNKSDCCHWEGVGCSNHTSRVIELDLNYLRDQRLGDLYFNASMYLSFKELRRLFLASHNLVGWFENEGFDKLSSLRLEALDLTYNSFDRNILSSLSRLSSLKQLHLHDCFSKNATYGHQKLSGLNKLEVLDFSANDYINNTDVLLVLNLNDFINLKELYIEESSFRSFGTNYAFKQLSQLEALILDSSLVDEIFLQSIGVISSLKYLSLSECQLNGTLPNQGWCDLKHLEELDLSYNELEGKLPSCMRNMTSLRFLDLSQNKFIGSIPSSTLSNLKYLEYLSLSSNKFQMPISFEAFLNNSNLRVLFAERNEIIAKTEEQNGVPSFQLEALILSHCTGHLSAIPNFLRYQSELRYIDLSDNNLGLNFPNWLVENNTRLETISLRNNALIGSLQFQLSPHLGMRVFDISGNNINGQIPAADIGEAFPNLHNLDMSENAFDGSIPSSFLELKSLRTLDLSNNKLSGTLPEELFMGCSSLYYFKISNNKIRGQIFIEGPQLKFLYLDDNQFSRLTISENLSSTINLNELDISNNSFSGKLPRSVVNLTGLSEHDMSNNHFEGSIPEEICKLQELEVLELSANNFYGLIPTCFSKLKRKRNIYMNNNHLEGQLTYAFYNSSSLETLDLRDNKFAGRIPPSIGNTSSLSVLLLRGNQLEGSIPEQLCQMTGLRMIDISHNRLSGKIPQCLGNLTMDGFLGLGPISQFFLKLGFLGSYRSNFMLGRRQFSTAAQYLEDSTVPIGEEITVAFGTKRSYYSFMGHILNYMSGLDLSSNILYGQIPSELGNLTKIHALNLSHNKLTGAIPTTFSSMCQIESLDLSYNRLSGRIPAELTKLNFLESFSVAYNNLSGLIPDSGQIGTFDEGSYEGNAFLCGSPLPACRKVESTQPPTFSDDESEESGFLDMESFYVSFVVTYVCALLVIAAILYTNPYWRKVLFDFIERHILSFKAMF